MYAKTIISKRLIKDHMLANGLQPHTIKVTKPLVKAYKSAYAATKPTWMRKRKKLSYPNMTSRKNTSTVTLIK